VRISNHPGSPVRGIAIAGAVFVLSLLVSVSAVGSLGPPPLFDDPDVRWRIEAFEAARDTVDVLFLGSSRVLRGFHPVAFDSEMAVRGHRLRSFNLGFQGLGAPEQTVMLEHLLQGGDSPAWVFLEVVPWRAALAEKKRFTRRAIAWHEPGETLLLLGSLARADIGFLDAAELGALHLLQCGARVTHMARGPRIVDHLFGQETPGERPFLPDRGFEPLTIDRREGDFARRREEYLEGLDDLVRAWESGTSPRSRRQGPWEPSVAGLRRQVDLVRKAGARVIFVVAPTARETIEVRDLEEAGLLPLLLAFDDPARYPELYRVEHFFDREHLTPGGALVFSRLLADAFCRHLDGLEEH